MKAYLITTATIFGLITAAHVWRILDEGSRLLTEPFYLLLTLLAAALCCWGFLLVRKGPAE